MWNSVVTMKERKRSNSDNGFIVKQFIEKHKSSTWKCFFIDFVKSSVRLIDTNSEK